MDVTIDQFRKEAAKRKRGRRRGSASYPLEMRRFAVDYAVGAIADGGSVSRAARELGVSEVTLAKWMQAAEADDGPGEFREVVVERPEVTAGGLVVVTPSGFRVEGLDLTGAAALLRVIA